MNSDNRTIPAWLANARSFRRSRSDRTIAGVAGGLAPRLGLSPVAARLGFVVLGLVGVGLPLYLAALIATRSEGDARPVGSLRLVGAIATAIGAWVLTHALVPFSIGGLAMLAVLIAIGALLVFGRRRRPESAPTVVNIGARPAAMAPPTLFLLAVGLAVIVAAGVWFFTRQAVGVQGVGAAAAAALMVIGAAQILGAWRGRSAVLVPIGLLVAAPLGIAAMSDVRLVLGSDDPGLIESPSGSSMTIDLGQGARPVTVTRDAFSAGLRSLVVRKPYGTVDLQIDPTIPARIEILTPFGRGNAFDYPHIGFYPAGDSRALRLRPRTSTFAGSGTNRNAEPVRIRIESALGTVYVSRSARDTALRAPEEQQRRQARLDLAGRQGLLRREQTGLARLRVSYRAVTAEISAVPELPAAVSPRILAIREDEWLTTSPTDRRLRGADPALKALANAERRLAHAQALRFDLLRAEWRVNSIERGISQAKTKIAKLVKGATP